MRAGERAGKSEQERAVVRSSKNAENRRVSWEEREMVNAAGLDSFYEYHLIIDRIYDLIYN